MFPNQQQQAQQQQPAQQFQQQPAQQQPAQQFQQQQPAQHFQQQPAQQQPAQQQPAQQQPAQHFQQQPAQQQPAQQQPAQHQPAQQQPAQQFQQQQPAQQSASPFSSISSAEVSQNSEYFTDGRYVVRLGAWEYKQGRNGNMLIIETEVIGNATGLGNLVGSRPSIFIKQNDSFLGNVKGLIIAASGFNPQTGEPRPLTDTVSKEEADAATYEQQLYNGAIIEVDAFTKMTKANTPFTVLAYYPSKGPAEQQPVQQQPVQQQPVQQQQPFTQPTGEPPY